MKEAPRPGREALGKVVKKFIDNITDGEAKEATGSPEKLQRTGSPERQRRSIQDRASEPRKPRERGSTEKVEEISAAPAGGPGRHPGGGKTSHLRSQ